MDTDFKSLEQRYGTLLATKIFEEIARADTRHFNFYKIPDAFRALRILAEEQEEEHFPRLRDRIARV